MNNGKLWMAPLTGLLFIAALIAAFALVGEPPDAEEPVAEIVDFWDQDKRMFGAVLQAVAGAMLIFFASYVSRRFRDVGARATATLILAGAGTVAIGLAIDGTIGFALADNAADIEPDAVQALAALWNNDFLPLAMGMFVFLIGFGAAIVRHGELPTWLGWVGIVAAFTAMSPLFPVAGIVAVILIAVSSIVFARRERAGGAGTGAPPPAA